MRHSSRIVGTTAIVVAFLLLPVVALPAGTEAQSAPVPYRIEDPGGDAQLDAAENDVDQARSLAASTTAGNYVDITGFTITEPSIEAFRFEFENVRGFQEGTSLCCNSIRYLFYLYVQPPGATTWALITIHALQDATDPQGQPWLWDAWVCAVAQQQPCGLGPTTLEARLGWENGKTVSLTVPKNFFTIRGPLGKSPNAATWPERIQGGDEFANMHLYAEAQEIWVYQPRPTASLWDRVPDSGPMPVYVVETDPGVTDLVLDDEDRVVEMGATNVIPLTMRNGAPNARRIALEASVVGVENAGAWNVSVTPKLLLPPESTVNATLRLKVPPAATFATAQTATIRVLAKIENEGHNFALNEFRATAVPPLQPGLNPFYFHSLPIARPTYVPDGQGDGLLYGQNRGFVSRFLEDSSAVDADGLAFEGHNDLSEGHFLRHVSTLWPTGPRDGIPARAAVDEVVPMHLVIDNSLAGSGTFTAELSNSAGLLASGSEEVELSEGENILDLEVLWTAAPEIEAGSYLNLTLVYTIPLEIGVARLFDPRQEQMSIMPRSSHFSLGLRDIVSSTAIEGLPLVGFQLAEPRGAMVNPGKTSVFKADVRNEEDSTIELELVSTSTRNWATRIETQPRVVLGPFENARIGIVIEAPQDAAEGDVYQGVVVARDVKSGLEVAKVHVTLTATSGVDVDSESFAPLMGASKGTGGKGVPGISAVFALSILTIVLAWRRRQVP